MDLFDEAVQAEPLTRTAAEQRQVLDEWGLEATLNDEPEPALPSTDGADDDEATKVAQRLRAAMSGATTTHVALDPAAPPMGLHVRSGHGSVTISDPAGGNGTSGTYNPPSPPRQRTAGNITCPKCQSTFDEGDDLEVVSGVGIQHKGPCPSSPPAGPAGSSGKSESAAQKAARLLAYADAVARGEQPEGPNPFAHVTAGETDTEIARAAQQHLALKSYSPAERQEIIEEGVDVVASNLDRLDIKGTHYEALEATAKVPEDEDLTFLDGDPNLGDF